MRGITEQSKWTTDCAVIRKWVEERGGRPVIVRARSRQDYDAAAPRIDFPQFRSNGMMKEITWEQFSRKFQERRMAFVYRETMRTGEKSRFFKLVSRDLINADEV